MTEETTAIVRVREATQETADAVDALLRQLSPRADRVDLVHLQRMVASETIRLFVATSGDQVVGMLTLIVAPVPSGWHGYIEDVIVDEAHRNKGFAARLVDAALDSAARTGAQHVDLTSNPEREVARTLYQRLGFEERGTTMYRYTIE